MTTTGSNARAVVLSDVPLSTWEAIFLAGLSLAAFTTLAWNLSPGLDRGPSGWALFLGFLVGLLAMPAAAIGYQVAWSHRPRSRTSEPIPPQRRARRLREERHCPECGARYTRWNSKCPACSIDLR